MKKAITIILTLSIILTCAFCLTACDKDDANVQTTYDGTLTVATNAAFPPFEMTGVAIDDYIGIDMELAYEIGKILNYKVDIQDMPFESVIESLESKTANVAMAGLTVSETRLLTVDFCDPYFNASQVVIAKTGSAGANATTSEALAAALVGKKVGYQSGTVGEYYVEGNEEWDFDGIEDVDGQLFTNGAAAMMALSNGQIDYIVIDELPAKEFVKKYTGTVAKIDLPLTEEEYAFAVQKGDTKTLTMINAAMTILKANGKFQEIVDKYYGED